MPRRIARAIVVHDGSILIIKRNKHGQQFYSLPGGAIEAGESTQQAAVRELREETSIKASVQQHVYHEEIAQFGISDYFVCELQSGSPAVQENSPEAQRNTQGENTYEPMWVKIGALRDIELLPEGIANRLMHDLEHTTWPNEVITVVEEGTTEL